MSVFHVKILIVSAALPQMFAQYVLQHFMSTVQEDARNVFLLVIPAKVMYYV